MLSVAKLKAKRRAYYCDALAAGLDDYCRGVGEAPGHWVGRGAEILGLADKVVDSEGFEAILAGRDPASGTELVDHPVQVLGYDATFCAPKSVSVLYGLGSPAVMAEVRAAHDAAVAAALGAYEAVACRARRAHAGATVVEADGFVGAAFHHRTSRSGDPTCTPTSSSPTPSATPGAGPPSTADGASRGPSRSATSTRRSCGRS